MKFSYVAVNCTCKNHIELFDCALRADRGTDGILKYMFDYTSGMDYKIGYVDMHVENSAACEWIEKHFGGKECCGVKVYNSNDILKTMVLPYDVKEESRIDDAVFSPAAVMLSDWRYTYGLPRRRYMRRCVWRKC